MYSDHLVDCYSLAEPEVKMQHVFSINQIYKTNVRRSPIASVEESAKRKTLEIDLNKEIWKGSMQKTIFT